MARLRTPPGAAADLLATGRPPSWFRWKYVEQPRAASRTVCLARDEVAVGVVWFPIRGQRRTHMGAQVSDMATHQDDRRRAEAVLGPIVRQCAEEGAAAVWVPPTIRGPSPALPAGMPTTTGHGPFLRLHRAGILENGGEEALDRWVAGAQRGLARARSLYDRVSRTCSPVPEDVARLPQPDPQLLQDLYGRTVPERTHIRRDPAFYAWRFADPRATFRMYVAYRNGIPMAAMVSERWRSDGADIVTIAEALPIDPSRTERHLATVLGRLVIDHQDADLIATTGAGLPDGTLERLGFLPADRIPVRWIARSSPAEIARVDSEVHLAEGTFGFAPTTLMGG